MTKPTLATVWLDGCSGCHMSFLDMDERLFDVAERADIVYSPLVDAKEYPPTVDFCLVEGAVSSEEDLHRIRLVRARTRTLISFGDCAVSANVPAMRNPIGAQPLLDRAYLENVTLHPGIPLEVVPALLPIARPVIASSRSTSSCRAVRRRPISSTSCSSTSSKGAPPTPAAPASAAEGTAHEQPDRDRPGHSDRRPLEDHDPPRRPGRGGGCPVPCHAVPGFRAHRPGPPDPRDAVDHVAHLGDLPGQPPDRVVEGVRPGPRGRAAAHRGRPAPGDEPGPDRPVQRPQLVPPLVARPAVRL